MHFSRDSVCDIYKKLKFFRDWFRSSPRDSYQDPAPKTTMVYRDEIYERSAPSFGVAEQPYRHIDHQEFEQHISQAASNTEHFQPPDMPVEEEPSVEPGFISDADLIEMAIDAVKDDIGDELENSGFEDNWLEDIEQAFDEADELFDDPFEELSLDEMLEDPMDDLMANDEMFDEMDPKQEMDDPQQMDPYMSFGGNPFITGG